MPSPTTYDLDKAEDLKTCLGLLQENYTSNFAVQFDASSSECCVNLDAQGVETWMQTDNARQRARWINFWADEAQKPAILKAASKYGLSPRLLGLLCPIKQARPKTATPSQQPRTSFAQLRSQLGKNATVLDVEKSAYSTGSPFSATTTSSELDIQNLSFNHVIDNMWHFCTTDWGQHFLFIGFNVLWVPPLNEHTAKQSNPAGERLWVSLILCDDGTVISVFERPADQSSDQSSSRRNLLNVFKHLSHVGTKGSSSSIFYVHIRPDISSTTETPSNVGEMSSLLFHYLFDDWMTTYAMIVRREHPYRDMLEKIRKKLSLSADVNLIESLHNMGRQLNTLKLMYKSYELIVARILHRYRSPTHSLSPNLETSFTHSVHAASMFSPSASESALSSSQHHIHLSDPTTAVSLHPSALTRFERLHDRIHLYALTELSSLLAEKETLVLMTINLVSLKESQAVERLTRTTILLAKATIMFLPVSLLTAYFSIQVGNLQDIYNLKTYWVSFAVVVVVTFVFLVGFGLTTNTVEGKVVYRGFGTMLWEMTKRKKQISP